jgi:hypothetical protein
MKEARMADEVNAKVMLWLAIKNQQRRVTDPG